MQQGEQEAKLLTALVALAKKGTEGATAQSRSLQQVQSELTRVRAQRDKTGESLRVVNELFETATVTYSAGAELAQRLRLQLAERDKQLQSAHTVDAAAVQSSSAQAAHMQQLQMQGQHTSEQNELLVELNEQPLRELEAAAAAAAAQVDSD